MTTMTRVETHCCNAIKHYRVFHLQRARLIHFALQKTGFICDILDNMGGRGNGTLKCERQLQNQELPFHYSVNTIYIEKVRDNMKN